MTPKEIGWIVICTLIVFFLGMNIGVFVVDGPEEKYRDNTPVLEQIHDLRMEQELEKVQIGEVIELEDGTRGIVETIVTISDSGDEYRKFTVKWRGSWMSDEHTSEKLARKTAAVYHFDDPEIQKMRNSMLPRLYEPTPPHH